MSITFQKGDAARDYQYDPGAMILQQNNCTACKLHPGSFAWNLASILPFSDPYSSRTPTNHYSNLAIITDRPLPGSIEIRKCPTAEKQQRPSVCCLFAQYRMEENDYQNAKHVDLEYLQTPDDPASRVVYFRSAMDNLKLLLINGGEPGINKIIIPHYIGCGAAGGDWAAYLPIICEFADSIKSKKIILVARK